MQSHKSTSKLLRGGSGGLKIRHSSLTTWCTTQTRTQKRVYDAEIQSAVKRLQQNWPF